MRYVFLPARVLIPCIAFVCSAVSGLVGQAKPSDAEVVSAVRRNVTAISMPEPGSAISLAAMAAGAGVGGMKVLVDTVDVLRFGAYNSQRRYWPVEVCVHGTAQNTVFAGFGPPAPVKPLHAKVRYRFVSDDFGDARVEEIPPAGDTPVASLLCEPRGSSARHETHDANVGTAPNAGGGAGKPAPSANGIEQALKTQFGRYPTALGKYTVRHAHAGANALSTGEWPSCLGVLFVLHDRVEYAAVSAFDGESHPLSFRHADIYEVKVNRLPIGEFGAFHITLTDKRNFNFATPDDRRSIVATIQKANAGSAAR